LGEKGNSPLLPPPPRAIKERKASENNINFESKFGKLVSEKPVEPHFLSEKERRGSCNNLWMNNLSPKQPRFSMLDQTEKESPDKKDKKSQKGWA
jgi:hypothetical protein